MNTLTIPEINLVDQLQKSIEYKIDNNLEIQSPKSLAFIVRWQLARKRAGSAKTKTMSEISGTTAKPWKQKGTGRARQGSKRSVQFVGGRTCHGPNPRDFDFSINKKIAKLALVDSIKSKINTNKLITYKASDENIKTSAICKLLLQNNIKSALIVTEANDKFLLGARNIKNVKVLDSKAINALDLINYEYIIINSEAFKNKIIGVLK